MNAAVRAVVRMGIYVEAKVYFIYEVSAHFGLVSVCCVVGLDTVDQQFPKREKRRLFLAKASVRCLKEDM